MSPATPNGPPPRSPVGRGDEVPVADGWYVRVGKRWFDLALALGCTILCALPMAVIAVLIRVLDGSPALFRQTRIGRNRQPFTLLKFRTMAQRTEVGSTITTTDDPRVTPLGRVLRRSKLDELPQLLNVLRGDMSFVGPRPDVPGYWDRVEGEDHRLLALRPGITGPATLLFRREENMLNSVPDPIRFNDEVLFPEKVRLAHQYWRHASFCSDLLWILLTVAPASHVERRLRRMGWQSSLTLRPVNRESPNRRKLS